MTKSYSEITSAVFVTKIFTELTKKLIRRFLVFRTVSF